MVGFGMGGLRVCKGFYERRAAGVLEGGAGRDASC